MHSNSYYDRNTNRYRKKPVDSDIETSDNNKHKRSKLKQRKQDREQDPIFRYRNGHET